MVNPISSLVNPILWLHPISNLGIIVTGLLTQPVTERIKKKKKKKKTSAELAEASALAAKIAALEEQKMKKAAAKKAADVAAAEVGCHFPTQQLHCV